MSAKMSNRPNVTYKKDTKKQKSEENEEKGVEIIDLTEDPLNVPHQAINQYPTYNKR